MGGHEISQQSMFIGQRRAGLRLLWPHAAKRNHDAFVSMISKACAAFALHKEMPREI